MARDLQYLLDYIEIRELSAKYNRYSDAADGRRFAEVFTADGELALSSGEVVRGHGELQRIAEMDTVTAHTSTDPLIEIDGDRATQTSRILITSRPADGGPNELVTTAVYSDDLRRTDSGWKFVRRRIETDLSAEAVKSRLGVTAMFDELMSRETPQTKGP